MATAHLPAHVGLGTPSVPHPSIGTPTFGPAQAAGTPTLGSPQVGTPVFGTSYTGTPTFGHSHAVVASSPGGGGTSSMGMAGMGTPTLASSSIQHVVQPVICSHPTYRGPVLQSLVATSKPRTPQDSAKSGALPSESPEEPDKCSTPYRLPRLTPTRIEDSPLPPPPDTAPSAAVAVEDKVWGRFGYEDQVRMPELGPSIHKALTSTSSHHHPLTPGGGGGGAKGSPGGAPPGVGSRTVAAAQLYRQSAMIVPKFRNAAIIPSVTPGVIRDVEDHDVRVYRSLLEKVGGGVVVFSQQHHQHQHQQQQCPADPRTDCSALSPAPHTPDSRSLSPAKSIHWALGSHRHPLFDYKGRSRKQGPYSREFTVHCMPPASWMRMKWGRQQRLAAH
ncbi:uncharacterized protein LOC143292141 [Babylonia areolata]|uniref:uncharacterized protein LOC143292141 n=1 Tax=Babylonia areolata TaxID=304850 RepID=UPI003FD1BAE4